MLLKRVIKKLFKICTGCTFLYKTNWYKSFFVDADHQIYPSNYWYREHGERNFDIVNLGSSSAKWAFDYTDTGIKGMNWAQQPQTLLEDFNLLRNFHSILRKGGYVLITIMPFTSLNKETGVLDAMKYLKIGSHSPIEPEHIRKAYLYAEFPILMGKKAMKALVKYLLGFEKTVNNLSSQLDYNPMTLNELEQDAARWINGWKQQFGIADFDAPLTLKNEEDRKFRINLMRDLIDFCIERGYKPIYVIPPVTGHLSICYTLQFEETYIYSFLRDVDRNVQVLDYSKNVNLVKDELFFNSFFLNKQGRKLFTNKVLKDLKLVC